MTAIIRPKAGTLKQPHPASSHTFMLTGSNLLSLSAFVTTDIEESDIAAASIGICISISDPEPSIAGSATATNGMHTAL